MRSAAAALLVACATPAPAPEPTFEALPLHIGPTMTEQQCGLIKFGGQKFDVDMQAVPLEKALRGVADCTCFHFEIKPGTEARITLTAAKPLNADELFAEFVKVASAAGVQVRRQEAVFIVEPK